MIKNHRVLVKVFVVFVLSLYLSSCTKIVEIEIPDTNKVPVINCLFSNDSILQLRLSSSFSLCEDIPSPINNANILLFENDLLIENLSFLNGFYESNIVPKSGKRYSIKASIPEFDNDLEIIAFDTIPSEPILYSFSFNDSAIFDMQGYPASQAIIEIEDNSYDLQYYEVMLIMKYKRSSLDTIYEKRIADYCVENYDPVLTDEGLLDFKPKTLVFSNKRFIGQKYSLKINFQNTLYLEDSYPQFKELKLIVHLRKVSKSYYKYKKQLTIHQSSLNSDFWSGTTEPSTMYSNITGGYGIFAGYTQITDTITKYYGFIN